MSVDRSIGWLRQGYDHPSPWGTSVPDEWADTELHFYSRVVTSTPNAIGGFGGSAKQDVVTLQGRAELVTEGGTAEDSGMPLYRRFYDIYVGLPLPDGSSMPGKGQRVWFLNGLGDRIDVSVEYVDVPEGGADHLEIRSEDIT